jgi:hypothetical protein
MQFSNRKNALKFFNLSMIEHNHRDHAEYNMMKMHGVLIDGKPHMVVTGLAGDIFIFAPTIKRDDRKPSGYALVIDGAVEDGAGPEPLTDMTIKLFNEAVSKGHHPTELLACINEHRTCMLAPEEMDDFDEAYSEELAHLAVMLELLS